MTEGITREEYLGMRDCMIESRNEIRHINQRLTEYIEMQKTDCHGCREDHEDRIKNLESWRDKAIGYVAAVGTAGGAFGGWVFQRLFGGA